jgi:hypothetical protein
MAAYTDTLFNGVSLRTTSVTPSRVQSTKKQIVGKTLTEIKVLGLTGQQWELNISGVCYGTTAANLSVNRAAIEALDDATTHAYVDGIHDGNFIVVPGSLQFNDADENINFYRYSLKLVEE